MKKLTEHKITHSLIEATLFHLDGTKTEIELKMPVIPSTRNSDAYWIACTYLEKYINHLSTFYMKIRGFQFNQFYVFDNGDKKANGGQSKLYEIPLDKVWNEQEGWIDLARAKELHRGAIGTNNMLN